MVSFTILENFKQLPKCFGFGSYVVLGLSKNFLRVSSIVIRRVSLGGGGGLFDGRGLWGPTKSRVQKDPFF